MSGLPWWLVELSRNVLVNAFVRSGQYYFWDPLTVAIAVNEDLGTFARHPVIIVKEEGPAVGATRIDENGSLVRITINAAEERFKQHVQEVLNG